MPHANMGSDALCSANEAAGILGVKPRSISNLVRSGLLRPQYQRDIKMGTARAFLRVEVEALAEARARKHTLPEIAAMAAQAFALARANERRLVQLEVLLTGKANGLELDEDSVLEVYAEAKHDLSSVPKDTTRILHWARVFLAMGEEYLDLLEAYSGDEQCWQPFVALRDALVTVDLTHADFELRTAYVYLDVGARNLRNVLFFHIANRYGVREAHKMFFPYEDVHEEILGIIAANN